MSNYHRIDGCNMVNGRGIRTVIWLSGCPFHCKKCFSPQTWRCDSGIPFDEDAYNEFINGGIKQESEMFYSDYLDYWMKEYFEINYKYSTARRYKETFGAIKKELGMYKLNAITPYLLNQVLLKLYQKTSTKEALRNYQKVIKSSLRDAAYYFGFIENNPAGDLQIPRVLSFELKKTI